MGNRKWKKYIIREEWIQKRWGLFSCGSSVNNFYRIENFDASNLDNCEKLQVKTDKFTFCIIRIKFMQSNNELCKLSNSVFKDNRKFNKLKGFQKALFHSVSSRGRVTYSGKTFSKYQFLSLCWVYSLLQFSVSFATGRLSHVLQLLATGNEARTRMTRENLIWNSLFILGSQAEWRRIHWKNQLQTESSSANKIFY